MKNAQKPKAGNKLRWRKYAGEFLSIFVAVIAAFALNNWNENRREEIAASKILTEIINGLDKDLNDVDINLEGHKQGIEACKFWCDLLTGKERQLDTMAQHYLTLTRDFTSIQNTSGYETLKSRGFELIRNDSLRGEIISLYEFDYQTLRKLEEEFYELQFQRNYFKEINKAIAPHFIFDTGGNITGIDLPIRVSESERKIVLSYLWKIRVNRRFVSRFYDKVRVKIENLQSKIRKELEGKN